MAPRETAAQKRSRFSALLAEFDARNRELNKLTTIVKGLKAQIEEIPVGTYGDWILSTGTPREMLDQQAVKQLCTEHGLPIPTKVTRAPIIVSPKVGK